jgi:hypothetical protein
MECHEFEIEVRPDGHVHAHIKGVKGQACLDYVKLLEQVLGEASDLQHTTEYYEPPTDVATHLDHRADEAT